MSDAKQEETAAAFLNRLGDNAQLWAQEFVRTIDKIGRDKIDEGLMISWFANAIGHSNDVRRWRQEAGKVNTSIRPSSAADETRAMLDANDPPPVETTAI